MRGVLAHVVDLAMVCVRKKLVPWATSHRLQLSDVNGHVAAALWRNASWNAKCDYALIIGVLRHGCGNWLAVLDDAQLSALLGSIPDPMRVAPSLFVRDRFAALTVVLVRDLIAEHNVERLERLAVETLTRAIANTDDDKHTVPPLLTLVRTLKELVEL
jgi:hypothetical protein